MARQRLVFLRMQRCKETMLRLNTPSIVGCPFPRVMSAPVPNQPPWTIIKNLEEQKTPSHAAASLWTWHQGQTCRRCQRPSWRCHGPHAVSRHFRVGATGGCFSSGTRKRSVQCQNAVLASQRWGQHAMDRAKMDSWLDTHLRFSLHMTYLHEPANWLIILSQHWS